MQIQECQRYTDVKRDMDYVRDLLLQIEEDPRFDGTSWFTFTEKDELGSGHSTEELGYHLAMLVEADFVRGQLGFGMPAISKLTWEGHEFLDNIRDPGIWGKTKQRISGLTSVGLMIVGEIAKAEIKKQLGLP
ncbi:conserved hypothetical protein [Candidatus Sulfotelmatobacter kueseliae]|uniref:DUF2513 domain-containing protein n=1 Tax=Candidatus Sulfotelmatobacter kueseliae TaxID=2042962 RepID=A0A2U3L6W1_9BACT|nr:conserved hypothetical protein [Candidatus Sulfotelmatobacter kueseliae]